MQIFVYIKYELSLNISIKYCNHNLEVCSQCCHFYVTPNGGCWWRCCIHSKIFQTTAQCAGSRWVVDRHVAMLVCVDVLFCVVIWRTAEFHCHSTLPFITTFISCIDDNECLHTITLMYLSILNFVFTNWHHFVFSIKVLVNKAVSSYCKQRFWTTK